jgi:hypothetical protein
LINPNRFVKNGYIPVAGEWYPVVEPVRPRVYHEYAKQDVIGTLYPDLVTESATSTADIAAAIADAVDNVAEVKLTADLDVGLTSAGKFRTIMVPVDKTLIIDLNGHTYKNLAYLFYVYGTLIVKDSKGTGKLVATCTSATSGNNSYPAIFATGTSAHVIFDKGAVMEVLPDHELAEDENDWTYGIYASEGASATIKSNAKIVTYKSAALASNGTTGDAYFTVTDSAKLENKKGAFSIFMPNQVSVEVSGNSSLVGGITARQGQITVSGNAKITANPDVELEDFLLWIKNGSGYVDTESPVTLVTGCYTSKNEEFGNSLNFVVKDNAVVSAAGEVPAIAVITKNIGANQTAVVDITGKSSYRVYDQATLESMCSEAGVTYNPTHTTDLTVKVDGAVVYPVGE